MHNEGKKVYGAFNVILSWATESNLQINVKCGCGDWHLSGTKKYNFNCNTCGMIIDEDEKRSND